MKILVAGIIARYPFGGVTWCSLMYLLGLRALGHEVFYIEDTGECVYDPVQNTRATDPSYGTSYIDAALRPHGLGDRWSFVNYDGGYHGRSADAVKSFAADADLFINLSGTDYPSLAAAKEAGAPVIAYGAFINTVINFIIVAFAIFIVIKQINRLKKPAPAAAPTTKDCPRCATAIPLKATRCPNCTSELAA